MKNSILLQDVSPDELISLIMLGVKSELEVLKKDLLNKNAKEEILTREEVADLLQINLSTLWHWQNKGKIKVYGISGSRRYYKRSEIMDALKLLKK